MSFPVPAALEEGQLFLEMLLQPPWADRMFCMASCFLSPSSSMPRCDGRCSSLRIAVVAGEQPVALSLLRPSWER